MPTFSRLRVTTAAVQDSHDDAFAEHRRQHADAQVDRVTTDHQFDPTVLRHASFGDVQIRHHLDARRDREGQVTRRRHHFVQHAFGLDANAKLVLERFKVNVAGVVLDRQQQHHVQQFANRRRIGQRFGVGDVELFGFQQPRSPL